MKMVEITCVGCGKVVQKKAKYITFARKHGQVEFHCSVTCYKPHPDTLQTTCHKCGKPIEVRPSVAARSQSGFFYCSRSCSNSTNNSIYKSGENHPNYVHGFSARDICIGDVCSECGDPRLFLLVTHHKDGNRANNTGSNREKLCWSCHALRHLKFKDGALVVDWKVLTSPEIKALLKTGISSAQKSTPFGAEGSGEQSSHPGPVLAWKKA